MRTFDTLAELAACAGQEIAVTDWHTMTQQNIDQFAEATGVHQWIHVDPERAKAGPFGTTIAHGYLTLSMLAGFLGGAAKVKEVRMGINYGLNKVRFMAPVPVGSRLRARFSLVSSDPIDNNGVQLVWDMVVEKEGSTKPVCVAQSVSRRYP